MKKTAGRGVGQSAAKHRNRHGAAGPPTRMTRNPGARQPADGRALTFMIAGPQANGFTDAEAEALAAQLSTTTES